MNVAKARRFPRAHDQRGTTLVETLIAMTIGLMLLAALSQIFVANGSFRRDLDRSSRLVENASYAMERLGDDLRSAGYYAEFDVIGSGLALPATKPDPCSSDIDALAAALPLSVQGYDSGMLLPPSCTTGAHAPLRDRKLGTDVLVVRRVDSCVAGPTTADGCAAPIAGAYYFQASHCTWAPPNPPTELAGPGQGWFKLDKFLSNLSLHNIDCNINPGGPVADYHRYVVHIYFIANDDVDGDGIPTLKVARLDAGGFTDASVSPLAQGIEDLQFEYGLDTVANEDGSADAFTPDPDTYAGCAGAAAACSAANWASVVSVRVHMLGRNSEPTPTGYVNNKSFTLGLNADGSQHTIAAFNDKYKRHVYQASVRLYNASGRSQAL